MTLTEEQELALASFPDVLRQLVHDELASGNSIVEIGHSFPAPPAGAYIKLANTVSTRPRASDSGLSYRARNSAITSGEFTDERRFYFVVEPPGPPEPEPDMDATRREYESRERSFVASAKEVERGGDERAAPIAPTAREFMTTHSQSGVEYTLHFHDARTPHEVQFVLERIVRVLFALKLEEDKLSMRAKARVNGASYTLTLHFVAAMFDTNRYVLRVVGSWAQFRPEDDDYFRRTSRSWVTSWTKDLGPTDAPSEAEGSAERYREFAETAMRAEAHLDSVTALKQAVVAGIKRGGRYVRSHKEGDTEIRWRNGAFVRTDRGDNPAFEKFTDETSFLDALRQFCNWDIMLHAATDNVPDIDAWRLVFRRMDK